MCLRLPVVLSRSSRDRRHTHRRCSQNSRLLKMSTTFKTLPHPQKRKRCLQKYRHEREEEETHLHKIKQTTAAIASPHRGQSLLFKKKKKKEKLKMAARCDVRRPKSSPRALKATAERIYPLMAARPGPDEWQR